MTGKVLIVTIWDNENIGNRLQNYALNRLVSIAYKCEADNLVYYWHNRKWVNIKNYLTCILGRLGFSRFKRAVNRYYRIKALSEWSRKYIGNQLVAGEKYEDVCGINFDHYEMVITGSDQVWHNWHRQEAELDFYYLQFVPFEKRACFAPSFGFDKVPEADKEKHIQGLLGIQDLSCREESGCFLINELTGKPTELLPDPTLCLSRSEWKKILKKPNRSINENNYILLFFLGAIPKGLEEKINNTAKNSSNEVIIIGNESKDKLNWTDPSEMLWLIENARFIYTDSYHITVFSIIFNKDFYVFPRNGSKAMFGRFNTLLSKMNLSEREYTGQCDISLPISPDKYDFVNEMLVTLRDQAMDYLLRIDKRKKDNSDETTSLGMQK